MTQWFFEIRSGEIPALMQEPAILQLKNLLETVLNQYHVTYTDIQTFVTPTRIGANVMGLPLCQADREDERRGPRVDAPQAAIDGFLALTQAKLSDLEKRRTDKGEFYFYKFKKLGQNTDAIIPFLMQQIIEQFNWPKSMLWQYSQRSWIRPITGGCCIFNGQGINYQLKINDQENIHFDRETVGHRFLNPAKISVTSFEDYKQQLFDHHIIVDSGQRQQMIMAQIEVLCAQYKLVLEHDEILLKEITGLVEYPFVYLGSIEPQFMELPPEVLKTSMRVHQRYFSLRNEQGNLAPYFIVVANIPGQDQGKTLLAGNERVLKARLSDAQFFFAQDKKIELSQQMTQLDKLMFHRKLGTIGQKITRVKTLLNHLKLDAVILKKLITITELAKVDLTSQMVGEFPELQGIMGAKYAALQGYEPDICQAIYDQYLPRGTQDDLPQNQVGQWYGLIERLDTLVGFFMVGIQPSGSKDPFALRRTAFSIIRLLENNSQFNLINLFQLSITTYRQQFTEGDFKEDTQTLQALLLFIHDRLKVYWRDQNYQLDHVQAVLELLSKNNLSELTARLQALQRFKSTQLTSYVDIIALTKRIHNIMQQQDDLINASTVDPQYFESAIEKELYEQIQAITPQLETENYDEKLKLLSHYSAPITIFFDQLIINADNKVVRHNRLALLKMIYDQIIAIADFHKFEG